jgi:hypothetical protein
MSLKPEDEMLAPLFQSLRHGSEERPDLNRINELASKPLSALTAEDCEAILSLQPEMMKDLMALRELPLKETLGVDGTEEIPTEILSLLARAPWRGDIRIGYTGSGLFRVSFRRGEFGLNPWIGTTFEIAKRMLGIQEIGLWPAERIEFSWPREKSILKSEIRLRKGTPVLRVRHDGCGERLDRRDPITVQCWRGGYLVGEKGLDSEDPELVVKLKSDWPYLIHIRGENPAVLKVLCRPVELSPSEMRMAALLRVLMGNVSGGLEMIRKGLIPSTPAFRWVLSILSRCLPEPACQMGFSVVRDAAVRDDVRAGVQELFTALAVGWLGETGRKPHPESVMKELEERKELVAHGFLFALRENYEEALSMWESDDRSAKENAFVIASRTVAEEMLPHAGAKTMDLKSLPERDVETAMQSVSALAACRKRGFEDYNRLADALAAACR